MKITKKLRGVVVGGAMMLAGSVANAGTVTFDLAGHLAATSSGFQLTSNGVTALFQGFRFLTLNALADTIADTSTVTSSQIGRYNAGVGVTSGFKDSPAVDSYDGFDFVSVTLLTGALRIANISFGSVIDGQDSFRWMWDTNGDGAIGGGDTLSQSYDITDNSGSFGAMTGQSSSVFGFLASDASCGVGCTKASYWKLRSISFDVTAVPLPASWFLMLAALGGLVVARRRSA